MDYHTEDDQNLIQEWYESVDEAVQAAFEATLVTLGATEDWTDLPEFKELTKRHAGLSELRVEVQQPEKRQFRAVGVWRPEGREFIFLLGCRKHARAHLAAFDRALQLKAQLDEGRGSIHEHV